MARSASPAIRAYVAPRAEFRGIRTAADDRLRPARGILLGLGLSSAIWAVIAAAVLF